jgi:hypothetical protein
MDDNVAVIGTRFALAAYVFVQVNHVDVLSPWTQMAKLTGISEYGNFGYSVAVAGNVIVVGDYLNDNINGMSAGAAFVFTTTSTSSSSSWTLMAGLLAADGYDGDNFGVSLTISKDASTIVVGAPGHDVVKSIGYLPNAGCVYLFRTTDSSMTTTETTTVVWTQSKKICCGRSRI